MYYVNKGALDASKTITIKELYLCGAISKVNYGVKLLCRVLFLLL
jgi:hypothetical protein